MSNARRKFQRLWRAAGSERKPARHDAPTTRNKGRHILHYGGPHDSHVEFFEGPPA